MAKLKYGVIDGKPEFTCMGKFAASQVISRLSGRYVVFDASDDDFDVCADDAAAITGYVEQDLTTNATADVTELPIATNVGDFVTEMPYALAGTAGTLTQALLDTYLGDTCDLAVISSIQYADIATDQDVFVVVGGSVVNNTLYVRVIDSVINQKD